MPTLDPTRLSIETTQASSHDLRLMSHAASPALDGLRARLEEATRELEALKARQASAQKRLNLLESVSELFTRFFSPDKSRSAMAEKIEKQRVELQGELRAMAAQFNRFMEEIHGLFAELEKKLQSLGGRNGRNEERVLEADQSRREAMFAGDPDDLRRSREELQSAAKRLNDVLGSIIGGDGSDEGYRAESLSRTYRLGGEPVVLTTPLLVVSRADSRDLINAAAPGARGLPPVEPI